MKITKKELKNLIKEEVSRFKKIQLLENRKKNIQKELSLINEDLEDGYWDYNDAQPDFEYNSKFHDIAGKYGIVGLPYDNRYVNAETIFLLGITDRRDFYDDIKNPKSRYFKKPYHLISDYIEDGERLEIDGHEYRIAEEFEEWMVDESKMSESVSKYYNKLLSNHRNKDRNKDFSPKEKIFNLFGGELKKSILPTLRKIEGID